MSPPEDEKLVVMPGVPCEVGGPLGSNESTRPDDTLLVTFCGNGLAWPTGCTAGGWATTAMARSPLSAGGAGLGVLVVPAVEPLAAGVPELVADPVPELDFEPPLDEALLLGLMLLNRDEPVSVPSTEVRLPVALSLVGWNTGVVVGVAATTRLLLSTLT